MWVSRATLCLPKTPAPEGRHSDCRGREAPGLEGMKLPPIPAGCYSDRHFDVGPPGMKRAIATLGPKKSLAIAAPHGRDARATMWVSRATLCLPKTPAPEGRHSDCRGREAPGLEEMKLPPIPAGCYRHQLFDLGPPSVTTMLESRSGSGLFAVRSSRQIRLIVITGQPPHDESREPTATHTLQESRRVCEPIARLAGRSDFTGRWLIPHPQGAAAPIPTVQFDKFFQKLIGTHHVAA
jgi:hypothetical protein